MNELQNIYRKLNAYRQGWISYDREHVQELQERREQLERDTAA